MRRMFSASARAWLLGRQSLDDNAPSGPRAPPTGATAEGQRITAGLERQHENELARRQAAVNALARWSQTQQMIDAANRPVITNCTRFGDSTNCLSR
jgi:hypothetical protein